MLAAPAVRPLSDAELSAQTAVPTTHRLIVSDARAVRPHEVGSVELVVTSPPYWTIVDYRSKRQIGFGQTLTDYVRSLQRVWRLCYSVLRDGCRMAVNIGDQYLRATPGTPYHIIPLHALVVNSIQNAPDADFLYLGSIVWRKISTTRPSGGATVMGSYPYPRSVYPCFENEFIAIFRKPGDAPKPDGSARELARMDLAMWRDLTQGVWSFPGAKAEENPAPFPEALPARIIRMFTFPGETVLDPFVGSGTTMRAAASLGRNSVGIELGFPTISGRPFEKVVEERVVTAGREPYAGPPSFVRAPRVRRPAVPQPSHS